MPAPDAPLRLAVLASGRGSNLQAIVDAIASGRLHAEVVGVFSDRPQAPALQKVEPARRWSASPRDFADRAAFDAALGQAIAAAQPDWVICAGYMRILGEPLVRRFAGRMLNIHPRCYPNTAACTRTRARWKPAMQSMVPACIWWCRSWMPAR